jgi:hypothetical protein
MGLLLKLLVDRVGSIPKEKISQEKPDGGNESAHGLPYNPNSETALTSAIRWR